MVQLLGNIYSQHSNALMVSLKHIYQLSDAENVIQNPLRPERRFNQSEVSFSSQDLCSGQHYSEKLQVKAPRIIPGNTTYGQSKRDSLSSGETKQKII